MRRLRSLTYRHDALLILNDDWRRAVEFDCDGVHLGPGDDGFEEPPAVRAAAKERLIGLSCGTAGEVARAAGRDVDYLGVGSVFATSSKADAGTPIGLAGSACPCRADETFRSRRSAESVRRIWRRCAATGVAMAAVISALCAPDVNVAARRLLRTWAEPE